MAVRLAMVNRGSYPSMATQGLLQQLEEDRSMRAFFDYQVSFWWANKDCFLITVFFICKKGQSFFWLITRSLFFFAKPLCWFLNETSTRLRGKHIRKHRKCWARLQEMTQFSDIDLSRPVCNSLWRPVKEKANLIAATNDSHFCGSCTEQLKETQPIQEPVENDYCESCSI